jgi:hypothetical protein
MRGNLPKKGLQAGLATIALTIGLGFAKSADAQMNGGGQMWGASQGNDESTKYEYVCFRKIGALYKSLGILYSIPQNSQDKYMGTTFDLDIATEASRRLQQEYTDAKKYCVQDQKFLPQLIVDPYLRGVNFRTGEFLR